MKDSIHSSPKPTRVSGVGFYELTMIVTLGSQNRFMVEVGGRTQRLQIGEVRSRFEQTFETTTGCFECTESGRIPRIGLGRVDSF